MQPPHPRNRTGNGAWRAVFGGAWASLRDARAFAWPIHGVDFCFHGMDFRFHGMDFRFHGMDRPIHGVFSTGRWAVSAARCGRRGPVLPCRASNVGAIRPPVAVAGGRCGWLRGAVRSVWRRGRCRNFLEKARPRPLVSRALPVWRVGGSAAPRGRSVRFFKKNGRARQRFRKIT